MRTVSKPRQAANDTPADTPAASGGGERGPDISALARAFAASDEAARLAAMSPADIDAWENRGIPSAARATDRLESAADEKQNATSSLNFPLHWTTARESWQYLYDFALASELLAPRPDDLVLDFAAGTCWAAEMLTRLGVRTVSIDLSAEMLRRGRERLAADARLVFRDAAAFVAARGQALPFADESFDGVLCMNALHHLPSYGAALAEIYRVLRPGGRAAFSEPGTAHADAEHSRFRMREETVLEKSVALPAVYTLARHAGFTRMRVLPLRGGETYVFDYSASEADTNPLVQMWEDTLKHVQKEHARFVLYKGGDRPADTLLPAAQLTGRLRAGISLVETQPRVAAGEPFADRVRVTNTGTVTWKARGRRFGGQTTLGVKICNEHGEVLREDLGRTPLSHDVAPGESIDLEIRIAGALPRGAYRLRYDMVVEGVTWFEFHGSPCPTRPLIVA
jgi:ubiquinone/menaquinone biosynthesis C-methylase UbiE